MPTTISRRHQLSREVSFASGERDGNIIRLFYDDRFMGDGKRHSHLRSRMELISSCPTKNNLIPILELKNSCSTSRRKE